MYGSAAMIISIDNRIYAAHIRNEQLFMVRHIGVDRNGDNTGSMDRVAVRWTQIDLSTTPIVVAEGTLFDTAH